MGPMWLIHRGGQQFGPADEETVRAWLGEGRVVPDDLVWTDGMTQWLRVASIAAFANAAVAVHIELVGVPGGVPVLRPGAVPAGPPQPTGTYPGSLGAFGSAGYIPEHLTPPPGHVFGPPPTGHGYAGLAPSAFSGSGHYQPAMPQPPSAGMAMLLPIGRSGWAIAAGYCGLFGTVIVPLAIVALVVGIVALRDIRDHPHLLGKGRAVFAIVVGAAWIVGIVAVVATRLASGG